MRNPIHLLGREVGTGRPTFVIGEIGLNHDGDLDAAKRLIQVAALAGCDAAKFQKRDVANLAVGSVLDAKDDRFPSFGRTYREIREHLEFDESEYRELVSYARDCGVPFLCTAFDIPSTHFLERLGVQAYKIASHSLTNTPLLDHVGAIGKPVILSTGMSTLDEVDQAVEVFRKHETPLILMHCVSAYPTPIAECNLRMIDVYRERYGLPVGYSGHEMGWVPTLAAVARGAVAIERHITLDSSRTGFDHKLSLAPDDLIRMVREIRSVEASIGGGEKRVSATEFVTRNKYHVSLVANEDIPAGVVISEGMLTLKNPGTGIPANKKNTVVGRRAKRAIAKDTLIEIGMLD